MGLSLTGNTDVLALGTLLRISDEELKLYGNDSIPLKDGGYAAGLGVAHNLHCVKKLKKFLYREHFYPDLNTNGAEFEYIQSHAGVQKCVNWDKLHEWMLERSVSTDMLVGP
ncbi:hypothetical protein E8E14_014516 [Neopestalotiopsis sp. 37M]|nr:hypothetical protein E8E14_014516 [Neopestalotiopsis sp. 37M]